MLHEVLDVAKGDIGVIGVLEPLRAEQHGADQGQSDDQPKLPSVSRSVRVAKVRHLRWSLHRERVPL